MDWKGVLNPNMRESPQKHGQGQHRSDKESRSMGSGYTAVRRVSSAVRQLPSDACQPLMHMKQIHAQLFKIPLPSNN